MDAPTIDLIASLMPTAPAPHISASVAGMNFLGSKLHQRASQSFIAQYMLPAFGWHAAVTFAQAKAPFPVPMLGRDHWVYRAYLTQLDPDTYFDKTVSMAYNLQFQDSGEVTLAAKLQSMLLSYNCTSKDPDVIARTTYTHLEYVANYLGLPYDLVEAYEILFFNIIDRTNDALFISHEVYPGTRFVEFQETYFTHTSIRDMVRRAGYNHRDTDMTAYLIGIGDRKFVGDLASRPDREEELSKHFMGNGLIMARANLLNHRSIGLSRATTLIAAARQGGQNVTEHPMSSLTDSFTAQVGNVKRITQEGYDRQLRIDAGEVIEA